MIFCNVDFNYCYVSGDVCLRRETWRHYVMIHSFLPGECSRLDFKSVPACFFVCCVPAENIFETDAVHPGTDVL